MRTRIGERNKHIELQEPSETSDGMGGYTETFSTKYSPWAAIWPLSGKDQIAAGQNVGLITHRIRFPYNSEVKSNWRVKYVDGRRGDTRYFSIVAPPISLEERNRETELLCKEAES